MDIKCALCGEPWDSYHVQHDMEPEDRKLFKAGKGCEGCKFGRELPIRDGQTFLIEGRQNVEKGGRKIATIRTWPRFWWDGPAKPTATEFVGGTRLVVVDVDHEHKCGTRMACFNPLVILRKEGGEEEWCILADELRSWSTVVPRAEDRERADELALDAARSALAASDEEPIGILIERGLM